MEVTNKFITYIDTEMEKMQQEEKALAENHRKDEANLVRIRRNIYEICKTIYGVVSKMKEGEALREMYLQRLEALPRNWLASYEKAKEHGDLQKQVIEEIKLKALEEVKAQFVDLCELQRG